MRVKDIVKKVIPKEAFLKLKYYYNKYKKSRIPVLSEEEFRSILTEKLGLKKGSVAFIHSSTGNMNLGFPAYRMLSIILDVIGEEGTALFPCHQLTTKSTYALKNNLPFDVKKTPSDVGLLPELARRHKGAFRSLHPTNSIVAIGKYADELTKEHHLDIYPCGIRSPYYKITEYDGIIIGIGVSVKMATFVHCIEDIYPEEYPLITRQPEIYSGLVIKSDGSQILVRTLIAHPATLYKEITKFYKRYIPNHIYEDMIINNVNYCYIKPKELFNEMRILSKNVITIYSKKAVKKILK